MLKENDFIWKEHNANNIKQNPLDEWYCLVDTCICARKYSIVPQYPSDDGVLIKPNSDPEYYILFESTGKKASEEEQNEWYYKSSNFDGYLFNNKSFIRVFKTKEEAEKRAYYNYKMIYGYVLSHIEKDVEKATFNHFVVK